MVDNIVFLVQNCKSLKKKINFKNMKLKKYALKWIYVTTTLIFGSRFWLTSPWPSGLGRQTTLDHLVKDWSGVRGAKFFFQKKIFDLSLILIFTLFFKPCVTFLLIYVAVFHKMAPLFSYEPTVIVPGTLWFEMFNKENCTSRLKDIG